MEDEAEEVDEDGRVQDLGFGFKDEDGRGAADDDDNEEDTVGYKLISVKGSSYSQNRGHCSKKHSLNSNTGV